MATVILTILAISVIGIIWYANTKPLTDKEKAEIERMRISGTPDISTGGSDSSD